MRNPIYGIVVIITGLLLHSNAVPKIDALSFDSPFASCPYKIVLDLSMQIMEDLLIAQEQNSQEYAEVLQDIVIGRLLRLQMASEDVCANCSKGKPFVVDDMHYLVAVIGRIRDLCAQIMASKDASKVVDRLLLGMQRKFEAVVQQKVGA